MKEPLINPLLSVTKKYLGAFSSLLQDLAIERYHYVLVLIEENDETLTQKTLGQLINIDKSYMVSIIDYLSEKGYVVRETSTDDRRKHIIRLTQRARQELPRIKQAFDNINSQTFKGLSEQQIDNFYMMIQLMEDNLKTSDPASIIFNIKRRPIN